MKKIIGLLMIMATLSTSSFAANSASATTTIKIRAIEMANIAVAPIDFGDYVIGDPNPTAKTAAITITNGTDGKSINITVPATLELSEKTTAANKATIALTVDQSTVTCDPSGTAGATLTANFTAMPTKKGDYEGTATISIAFN